MTADQTDQRSSAWVPLSVRNDPDKRAEFLALREGVPEGAQRMLIEWCLEWFDERGLSGYEARLKLLEIAFNQRIGDDLYRSSGHLASVLRQDDGVLLDVIDFVLQWASDRQRSALSKILRDSRSMYRVGRGEGDGWELQKSHSDELIELVEATAGRPGRAAEHLRIAWSNIAGRQPDPDKACWEATKAVEVAAKPIIAPNDDTTHLGKMLGEMSANTDRWETDLTPDESIERIMGMMRLVWEEVGRHGDEKKPIGVSPEAAEIVVQTAVILVNWFESDFVRRVTT